jgi:CRISPR-associated protein Cmr1
MPKFPEGDLTITNQHLGMEIRTYNIEVITPLFGGGVDAGKVDPEIPIRPSSIRGHLRFWWRATRGAEFSDIGELRQRESEIWGSTENPSPVVINTNLNNNGNTYPCMVRPPEGRRLQFKQNHPAYALFPFQGDRRRGIPVAQCTSNLSFTLILIYPQSLEHEIIPAVKAWTNFGGIGARTRRGCGALYCKGLAPLDKNTIKEWVHSFQHNSVNSSPNSQNWPVLKEKLLIKNSGNSVLHSWTEVVGLLKKFRQEPPVGRSNRGRRAPVGRSHWPEPETIRRLTRQRHSQHPRIDHIPDDAFPRAEFGLPIVFHFKDNPEDNPTDPDPAYTELYPIVNNDEKTRMSSPLILRPLRCANGDVVSVILRLKTPPLNEVTLKKAPNNPRCTKIRGQDLANYRNSPMGKPLRGTVQRSPDGSALDAFMSYAKNENDFTEVS